MKTTPSIRLFIGLIIALLLSFPISPAEAQPINISPKTVNAGTSPTLTISSSASFLNLSQVSAAQLDINPRDAISNIQIKNATAERLVLSFDVASTALGGDRALVIKITDDVNVSIRFVVVRDPNVCSPECRPPARCESGVCKLPQ